MSGVVSEQSGENSKKRTERSVAALMSSNLVWVSELAWRLDSVQVDHISLMSGMGGSLGYVLSVVG